MGTFGNAWSDIREGLQRHRLWMALASLDIRHRYRRSVLGPLWITASLAITVAAIGPLYGALFGLGLSTFLPQLAAGLVCWMFISGPINESAQVFVSATPQLRQMAMPLSLFVFQLYARHVLILLHNAVVLVVLLLLGGRWDVLGTIWLLVPGFALVSVGLIAVSLVLAIFCTRYHDMAQVVANLMMVLFFVSPIIWDRSQLPESRRIFVDANPLAQWLELLRAPLLGQIPTAHAWLWTGVSVAACVAAGIYCLGRLRHRVAYWL